MSIINTQRGVLINCPAIGRLCGCQTKTRLKVMSDREVLQCYESSRSLYEVAIGFWSKLGLLESISNNY